MINLFIEELCDILEIPEPLISFDTSHFPTETTLAQCNIYKNTIHIKQFNKPNPDQLFCIAHELRHLWQYKTNEKLYLSSYKPSNECNSVEEYNLQLAEIDANAFATLIMDEFFSMKPLFHGVSEVVKPLIFKELQKLKNEYHNLFYD